MDKLLVTSADKVVVKRLNNGYILYIGKNPLDNKGNISRDFVNHYSYILSESLFIAYHYKAYVDEFIEIMKDMNICKAEINLEECCNNSYYEHGGVFRTIIKELLKSKENIYKVFIYIGKLDNDTRKLI